MSSGRLVGEYPVRFGDIVVEVKVRELELKASSMDPLNRIPFAYEIEIKEYGLRDVKTLAVKVWDTAVGHMDREVMPWISVRYGLRAFELDPTTKEFDLTDKELDKALGQQLKDSEARRAILRLMMDVSKQFPPTSLPSHALVGSINAQHDEIEEQCLALADDGFLHKNRAEVALLAGGKRDTNQYRINVQLKQQILDELGASEKWSTMIDLCNHEYFQLGPTQSETKGLFAFVLMPFKEAELPQAVHEKVFEPMVRKVLGLNCVKVNNDKFKNNLKNKIFAHIVKSELVIAEISTENPNVVFELGLAFALEKHVILTFDRNRIKGEPKLAFDWYDYDTIFYETYEQLAHELEDALTAYRDVKGVS